MVSPYFFLKSDDSSSKVIKFLVIVTTPTLSAFQMIVFPVLFVNSVAKKINFLDFHQGVARSMVSPRGGPPSPAPSDDTEFYVA